MNKPGSGKVALITGSSRGLGRSFAERLATMGYDVGIHGLLENEPAEYDDGTTVTNTAAEIAERFGVKAVSSLGDLTVKSEVVRVVQEVTDALGPIDFLVDCAGGDTGAAGGKPKPNDSVMIKEADVRAVIERNLLTTIFVCQEVAKGMIQRGTGRIVTIGSQAVLVSPAEEAIYTSAKSAIVAYTRCLATQLRPYGINVNCLAPGDTRTKRFLKTREIDPQRLVTEGTLERIATLDEITRVIEFFAGPMGDFVSGQVLFVNGGHFI
jgi:3-oxoacyl-[acyl-carrier protein] reductase